MTILTLFWEMDHPRTILGLFDYLRVTPCERGTRQSRRFGVLGPSRKFVLGLPGVLVQIPLLLIYFFFPRHFPSLHPRLSYRVSDDPDNVEISITDDDHDDGGGDNNPQIIPERHTVSEFIYRRLVD